LIIGRQPFAASIDMIPAGAAKVVASSMVWSTQTKHNSNTIRTLPYDVQSQIHPYNNRAAGRQYVFGIRMIAKKLKLRTKKYGHQMIQRKCESE